MWGIIPSIRRVRRKKDPYPHTHTNAIPFHYCETILWYWGYRYKSAFVIAVLVPIKGIYRCFVCMHGTCTHMCVYAFNMGIFGHTIVYIDNMLSFTFHSMLQNAFINQSYVTSCVHTFMCFTR